MLQEERKKLDKLKATFEERGAVATENDESELELEKTAIEEEKEEETNLEVVGLVQKVHKTRETGKDRIRM